MDKADLEKYETTDKKIASNLACNSKQIIEKANEHPEWLPEGWSVEFRTRKSGTNMGAGYKCYIDPLNGYKFYSKPEVLRYLETIKGNSCSSEKGTSSTPIHSSSNVAVEKSAADDLPPGWTKEVRIRKNSNSTRKDPYYTDPVNRYVFRSKKDALRYIESGDISSCLFKPNKIQIQEEDKSTPSSTAKRQKVKHSATKRQLFVGKEISEKGSIGLSDANGSEKEHDAKVSAGVMVAPVPAAETIVKMHSLEDAAANPPKSNKKSDPADVQEKYYVLNVVDAGKKKHSSFSISKNKKGLNVPQRFSRRLVGIDPNQVADSMISKQALEAPTRSLRKSITTQDVDLVNKSSQLLNIVPDIENMDQIPGELPNKSGKLSQGEGDFREKPCQLETEKREDYKPEQHQYSVSHDYSSPSLKSAMNVTGEIGKISAQENKSSKKKYHQIPSRASKRLAGFEPDITNSINSEKPPEYKGRKSKGGVNSESHQSEGMQAKELADHASTYINALRNEESSKRGKKSPKIPPRTNEQLEKLGDEQLDDEKSEPQLSFAFHYSWSDPSVEFAIKTLTGVLPVEDSVDNGPVLVPETDVVQKNKLSKSDTEGGGDKNPLDTLKKSKNTVDNGSVLILETDVVQKNKLPESVTEGSNDKTPHVTSKKSKNTFDDGPVLVPETDVVQKNKLSKSVTEGSNDKNPQVTPKKSKNKKELSLPRRLSKRLAGHEPEVVPAERALEYAARKSSKDDRTAAATLGNGASKYFDVGEETELTLQRSDCSKRRVLGESSNESGKSLEAQIVPNEQLLKVEVEKIEFTHQASDCWRISINEESSNKSDKSHEAQLVPNEQLQKVEAEKNELMLQVSDCLKISVHEESLNKSEKSHEAQIVPNEKLQKVEAEKFSERSEPQLSLPFGNSWSDPCLEFAIKTLTGALPVDAATDILPVMTPDVNDPPNKELLGSLVEKCITEEAHDNLNQSKNSEDINKVCEPSKQLRGQPELMISSTSCENARKFTTRESCGDEANITKNLDEESQHFEAIDTVCPSKQLLGQPELCTSSPSCENPPKFATRGSYCDEVNISGNLFGESLHIGSIDMACQPSKQLLGQPELRTSSISCQNTSKFTNRESYGDEANITKNLDEGESLHVEAGNKSQFMHQSRNIDTLIQEESSNKFGTVLEEESAPAEQTKLETLTKNQEKSAVQFSAPLMDSWSDPCLEFAFKTLTGALPIEENLAIQGCFQEHANFRSQRDAASSMLPDFGSPSFSQNDISFHYNVGKSTPGQQSSMSSSILPGKK